MQALSAVSQNLLLNRKDETNTHSTRKESDGPSATFASYAFGPMDMPDGKNSGKVDMSRAKAVTGSSTVSPTISSSAAFLTQLASS